MLSQYSFVMFLVGKLAGNLIGSQICQSQQVLKSMLQLPHTCFLTLSLNMDSVMKANDKSISSEEETQLNLRRVGL